MLNDSENLSLPPADEDATLSSRSGASSTGRETSSSREEANQAEGMRDIREVQHADSEPQKRDRKKLRSRAKPPPPPPAPPSAPSSPPGPRLEEELGELELRTIAGERRTWFDWLLLPRIVHRLSGFSISATAHAVALVLLALVFSITTSTRSRVTSLVVQLDREDEPDLIEAEWNAPQPLETLIPEMERNALTTLTPNAPNIDAPVLGPAEPSVTTPITRPSELSLPMLLQPRRAPLGGGFEGRDQRKRADLLRIRGGTPESEAAVARGLGWMAAHQMDDGSWHFDHRKGLCQGLCRNPGSNASTTGATGLALLTFLGAGHSPEQGEYKDVVRRGLYYLSSRMLVSRKGGNLQEGTMYAHGIATIALCEAYAMTQNREYKADAQQAVDFICNAQHPAGGWRYAPGQPGDTTVTGWQIMALKSARMAGLHVPSPVIEQAKAFLNSMQASDGALYGYQSAEKSPTPTAVGLLCRMYTGWHRDDERLARGVTYLDALGPSKTDMYYDYYATQVLIHHDGPMWPRWNLKMREHLILTQAKRGHENGSWFFVDKHSSEAGGRLYTTAMAIMILEVYYRHMPLYTSRSLDVEF